MSNSRKLGRTKAVSTGGTDIPPGQPESSGGRSGDVRSPCSLPSSQPLQPLSAASVDGPTNPEGGTERSPPSVSVRGTSQLKGTRSVRAKTKKLAAAGSLPKKGHDKSGSVRGRTTSVLGPASGLLQSVEGPPSSRRNSPGCLQSSG